MGRVLAVVLLCTAAARADGKAFSRVLPPVQTPDQRAVVVLEGRHEKLAIETTFRGEDRRDYAWIVPLPSPPRVSVAPKAIFEQAASLSEYTVLAPQWDAVIRVLALLAFAAILGLMTTRRQPLRLRWVLLFVAAVILALAVSPDATLGSSSGGIHVLSREHVGSYDVATIESVDSGALLGWLGENGYAVPDEARTAVDAYGRDGWVFAAARVAAAEGDRRHPEPLLFEFETGTPVYPMRLTGAAANGLLDLDLSVFADGPVRCGALRPVRCTRVAPLGDLRAIAGDARILTRLVGRVSPREMSRDFALERRGELDEPIDNRVPLATAAISAGGLVTLLSLLPAALLLLFRRARRAGLPRRAVLFSPEPRLGRRGLLHTWLLALGVGLVTAVFFYATRA